MSAAVEANPWRWFWTMGEEPEFCSQADSREDAIDTARAQMEADQDDRGFTILEATKATPTTNIFDAENVLETFGDTNEECWGEDGFEYDASVERYRALEAALAATLAAWFAEAPPRVFQFGETRNQEFFPYVPAVQP